MWVHSDPTHCLLISSLSAPYLRIANEKTLRPGQTVHDLSLLACQCPLICAVGHGHARHVRDVFPQREFTVDWVPFDRFVVSVLPDQFGRTL